MIERAVKYRRHSSEYIITWLNSNCNLRVKFEQFQLNPEQTLAPRKSCKPWITELSRRPNFRKVQSIKRVASSFHHRQSQTVKRSFSNPSSSPSGAQEFYFQRNEYASYKSTETGFEKEKKRKKRKAPKEKIGKRCNKEEEKPTTKRGW